MSSYTPEKCASLFQINKTPSAQLQMCKDKDFADSCPAQCTPYNNPRYNQNTCNSVLQR